MSHVLRVTCILLCLTQLTHAENEQKLLAWKVENGGNDPQVIADQLAQLDGYNIYGLSEVSPVELASLHQVARRSLQVGPVRNRQS
jgi:hypothetical protein